MVELCNALPEGADLRLQVAVAVLEDLDLFQRADLPRLGLHPGRQIPEALLEGLLLLPHPWLPTAHSTLRSSPLLPRLSGHL